MLLCTLVLYVHAVPTHTHVHIAEEVKQRAHASEPHG